jgi:hypothetical protein
VGNNYTKGKIFGEPLFTVGIRSREFLSLQDLDRVVDENVRINLIKATVGDITENRHIVNKHALEGKLGGQLPVMVYNKLTRICGSAKTKYGKEILENGIAMDTLFSRWKKGSKRFRDILIASNGDYVSHNIMKFSANMEVVINSECSSLVNQFWNTGFYTNQMRTFLFKFHNNILPTNTMLSHFVRGQTRNCTFCDLNYNPDPEEETPYHLFFSCPTTEVLRTQFYAWLFNDDQFQINRHEFFCCGVGVRKQVVNMAVNNLFKFYIWENKLRKCVPVLAKLKKWFIGEISVMKKISKKFANLVDTSGLDLNQHRAL